jgi:esterase/lipase
LPYSLEHTAGSLARIAYSPPAPPHILRESRPRSTFTGSPADLDAYLKNEESAVPGIIPGTEKAVLWARGRPERTRLSIVYMHGWQGSRQEYVPVFDRVAAALGANLFSTRLTGHCTDGEAIKDATLEDWTADAREAYEIGRRIGERVILAGPSMGANLSLWLAGQGVSDLAALVLVSTAVQPAVRLADLLLLPHPLHRIFLRLAVGRYFRAPDRSERHRRFNPERYRTECALPLMGTVKLVRELSPEFIRVPSLWIYSERDRVINTRKLKEFYARMRGEPKELVNIPSAKGHNLAGDMFQPDTNEEVISAVLRFLRGLGA